MKSFVLISLPLVVSAGVVERRQFGISYRGAPKAPLTVTKLSPKVNSTATREKLIWGPYRLGAANGTHAPINNLVLKLDPNSDVLSGPLNGFCKDCMVLWSQVDLAKKDGSKADIGSGVYSHHLIMTNFGHPFVMPPIYITCPNGMPGLMMPPVMSTPKGSNGDAARGGMSHGPSKRQLKGSNASPKSAFGFASMLDAIFNLPFSIFAGQGDEGSPMSYATKNSDLKSGFWLGAKDTFAFMSEAVNYHNYEKDIYVSVEYEYLRMSERPKDWYAVGMGGLNTSPCGQADLYPPRDRAIKYESPPWDIVQEGYLIDIKPHLHDGGINMTMYLNKKEVCSSSAIYGGTDGGLTVGNSTEKWETITGYTRCENPIPIKAGDKLTMEAYYDVTQHRLRPRAHGHEGEAEGMAMANYMFARPYTRT